MFVDAMTALTMLIGSSALWWRWWALQKRKCVCGDIRSQHTWVVDDAELGLGHWGACTEERRVKNYNRAGGRSGWRYEPFGCQRFDAMRGGA